jgi:hypothetical protein
MTNSVTHEQVRIMLGSPELKVVFESPNNEYRIEYGTQVVAVNARVDAPKVRTYQLVDLQRGGSMGNPWGEFDLDKQVGYVWHLLQQSGYRLESVTEGWLAKCPTCGCRFEGEEWRTRPRACANPETRGKAHALGEADVRDREITAERRKQLRLDGAGTGTQPAPQA